MFFWPVVHIKLGIRSRPLTLTSQYQPGKTLFSIHFNSVSTYVLLGIIHNHSTVFTEPRFSYVSHSQALWVQLGIRTGPSHGDRTPRPGTGSAGHRKLHRSPEGRLQVHAHRSTQKTDTLRLNLSFKALSVRGNFLGPVRAYVCHTWHPSSLDRTHSGLSRGGNSHHGRSRSSARSPGQRIP